ncbi:hypothetical protein [Hymenobacter nivis]|uniref:Uncharacterized protein n=1 Tax=Hymenobacter nivis TaxID=1850093 RepID=A0A502GCA5_9BACT|nr:hypothetical protein [Hymenobacter nivis]TPG59484.1 hypothetical protein EAH73_21470 [Hymenobacter nivis]
MLAGLVVILFYAAFAPAVVFGVLRAFFCSERLPRAFKAGAVGAFGLLGLLGYLLWFAATSGEALPPLPRPQPAALTITQPRLRPYPLGGAPIEQVRYGAFPFLIVAGTPPDGQLLRVRFSTRPGGAPPNEINAVMASVRGAKATEATGRSVYDPSTKTVSGAFLCPLPNGQRVAGSFEQVPVVLQ